MPGDTETAAPAILERELPDLDEQSNLDDGGPNVVILYNCDCHTQEQVIHQLLKATEYPVERCAEIMLEAHYRGRAIAYTGSEEACNRVARILRQIRLQVETDRF
jgi:ATP-dependent Clp protease adapter protein ClpS